MQTFQIVTLVVTVLFGGGGIVAWYKVHKQAKTDLSGIEVQDKAATTADWNALSAYWQGEMAALRTQMAEHKAEHQGEISKLKDEVGQLRREQAEDAEHIDVLERWIWEGQPPPPPPRRREQNPKA